MVKVLLTIDTEFWPRGNWLQERAIRHAYERDINGQTVQGEVGIGYQMKVLNEHGLKAVFIVEALHASVIGGRYLDRIVEEILRNGHEVQLHIHPEWLRHRQKDICRFRGSGMKDYSLSEQHGLIEEGLSNLHKAGVEKVCAFRAGGYRANWDTLKALEQNGILFDTSHNTAYLGKSCNMPWSGLFLGPKQIGNVLEYPVTVFEDWPNHYRHLELCACSSGEMRAVLKAAWLKKWHNVVIVSHSFELLRRNYQTDRLSKLDRLVTWRFDRLCRFLSENSDKFDTCGFNKISSVVPTCPPSTPLRSHFGRTIGRITQQALGRII